MLEAAVAAGVAAAGGEALLGGILPTPGAPLLIAAPRLRPRRRPLRLAQPVPGQRDQVLRRRRLQAVATPTEAEIEAALEQPHAVPEHPGRVRTFHGALEDYLRALQERFADLDLTGRRILLDCANGATFRAAPEIFRRLGADIGDHRPRARRPQHQPQLRLDAPGPPAGRRCRPATTSAGFAFDGDGDRMLAVDRNGAVVDGDELIALAAIHLRDAGRLPGNGVAVTVMTNYGFHTAMAEHGVEVAITAVGDRYVLEALRERDWALGGEQSGHIIDRNFVPVRRRHRGRAAHARGARRRRPGRPPRDGEAAADARQRARPRPRRARARRPRSTRRSSASPPRSRAAAACCCARAAPSRSCA